MVRCEAKIETSLFVAKEASYLGLRTNTVASLLWLWTQWYSAVQTKENRTHLYRIILPNCWDNEMKSQFIYFYWCLYRHLCILPERFGKKDLLVRFIAKDVTSRHRRNVTSQAPVVSMTTRLIN